MNYKLPLSLYCLAACSFLVAADAEEFDEDSFESEEQQELSYQNEEEDADDSLREQLADAAIDAPWKEERKKRQILYARKKSIGKAPVQREILADADDENYPGDATTTPSSPMASQPTSAPMKPRRMHYDVYGDFLYWQASNTNALWAFKAFGAVDTDNPSAETIYLFHFDWDPGFRIGAAFKTTWEELTFDVNWTKFHANATNSHQYTSIFSHAPGSHNPDFTLYSLPAEDFSSGNPWRVKAHYKIEFNQIDFTFRKALSLSKNFTMSPFGGLRAVISEHSLNAERDSVNYGVNPTTPAGPFNMSIIKVKDYMKFIGLLGGFNANMKLPYGLGFYFGGDMFIGYGPDKSTNVSEVSFAGVISNVNTLKQEMQTTRWMYDIFTGFSWNQDFWDDKMNFLLSAGYEFHLIENTPMFVYNGFDSEDTFNNEPRKATTFQGLTIRAGVGF